MKRIIGLGILLLLVSCSTQKAKWGNIAYHNTTAHYNVWWNGNESLKEAVLQLEKNATDDYTQILPVYVLGTQQEAMSLYPQLDRAIEKGVKGIETHSIMVNGMEHVPYIPKCYLLTAKASFYKQDYITTENTCSLIKNQFAGSVEGDDAAILSSRCKTAQKMYADAELELDALVTALSKGNFSKKLATELYAAMAEATLPQEKYKKGVQFLKLALESNPTKEEKARWNFILGQIYQKLDKRTVATKYYSKSLSYTDVYVMEFNARLNIASCADLKTSDVAQLERGLDKMLSDKKNEEYKDQIYYAKGEMYMGMKNAKKACDNFARSVTLATVNTAQRAKSAIRLAEIQYELYENYDLAQRYYDTAMQVINSDYPHYRDIKKRYEVLTDLTSYTRVYERNDSLLAVADMAEPERIAFIQQKIERLKKQEEEAKKNELLKQLEQDAKAQQNTLQGDWYFYNANTVQQGKESFRQRWGNRVLEDYWFLSKKGMLGMGMIAGMENLAETEEEVEEDDTSDKDSTSTSTSGYGNPTDPHSVAYYLKDLPQTDSARNAMRAATSVALLNAGYIFYDGVNNTSKAMECYLRLANEYAEYDEVVQAFYMLYKIYDKQGNTPNANYYKDMVLMGFPDSDFANLLRDDEYYKEIVKREQILNDEYSDLYNTYRKRRYFEVIDNVRTLHNLYPGNPELARFDYWQGLAYMRIDSMANAVRVFEHLANDFPETDSIVPLAKAQLEYIKKGGNYVDPNANASTEEITTEEVLSATRKEGSQLKPEEADAEKELSTEAQFYRYKADMQHYVVVIVNDKHVRATDLQYRLADFNSVYYTNSGYNVNAIMFTDSTQILTIHRFESANEASLYWEHLQRDESPLKKLNKEDYVAFPISTQNYRTFYNRKNIDAYREFYEEYYKKSF